MMHLNDKQLNQTKRRLILRSFRKKKISIIWYLIFVVLCIYVGTFSMIISTFDKHTENKFEQQTPVIVDAEDIIDKNFKPSLTIMNVSQHDVETSSKDSIYFQGSVIDDNAHVAISSPYTYVWIVGSIHEDRSSYRGFIWAVLISVNILRKEGSTADFWLLVRLAPDEKNKTMPAEDERVLKALGINIQYLEKPEIESFGQLVFDKFLTINMTDYKRVMFLDADILPLTNLDFFFHLSDPDSKDFPTILKPNLIYSTLGEPCNTGFFVVEPNTRIFNEYEATVKAQHEYAEKYLEKKDNKLTDFFDPEIGWGYNFKENNDYWESVKKKNNRWRFHAVHSDQGLMYYVAKFLYKDVSIIIGHKIQNWKGVKDVLRPEKESETTAQLEKYQPKLLHRKRHCRQSYEDAQKQNITLEWNCAPPYNSWSHFFGRTKPWQKSFDLNNLNSMNKTPRNIWWLELIELNERLEMGLELEHWDKKYLPSMKESPLGYLARFEDQGKTKQ